MSPNITYRSVIAGFIAEGRLVQLERFCGEHRGINGEGDAKTQRRVEKTLAAVQDACAELGLECRAGCFEEFKNAP